MNVIRHQQMMMAARGGDPYWSYVLSMMNFEGSTFVDEKNATTWANPGGSAVTLITTVGNPFGSGNAAYFNGSAYLRNAGFALGAGDWTVEFWVNQPAYSGTDREVFDDRSASVQGNGFYCSESHIRSALCASVSNNSATLFSGGSLNATANIWTHYQFDKASGTIYAHVNGIYAASVADARTLGTATYAFLGASYGASQAMLGYLGGWRLTGGIARNGNVSSFTPPTAKFPNH